MGYDKNKRPVKVHSAILYSSGADSTGPVKAALGFRDAVQSVSTAGTTITNYGISVITATGALTATLAAPVAGYHKKIVFSQASSGNKTAAVTCAAGSYFNDSTGATTDRKATFNAGDEALELVGLSTAAWFILNNRNTVSVGTT
jgi:hypothetical protein